MIFQLREFVNQRIIGRAHLVSAAGGLARGRASAGGGRARNWPDLGHQGAVEVSSANSIASSSRPISLPDLTGTEITAHRTAPFTFQQGPCSIISCWPTRSTRAGQLRAALRRGRARITIGRVSYPSCVVMAPTLEQEAPTLPEAQLDFLLHQYRLPGTRGRTGDQAARAKAPPVPRPHPSPVSQATIFGPGARSSTYMVRTSSATCSNRLRHARRPPRRGTRQLAGLAAARALYRARPQRAAHAWLKGADYVSPADIQEVAHDCLRHRLILNYEAAADGITPDRFIDELLGRVAVP